MFPIYFRCTGCNKGFRPPFQHVRYLLGAVPEDGYLSDAELLEIPVRPAWCKDCCFVSMVEDILPVRAFEDAYGAVRTGRHVEYPVETACLGDSRSVETIGRYLAWRMGRHHSSRMLCCGGMNYQLLDLPEPLLKHAGCDVGVIETVHSYIGMKILGPAEFDNAVTSDYRIYDAEGELLGRTRHPRTVSEVTGLSDSAGNGLRLEPASYAKDDLERNAREPSEFL